LRWTMVVCIIAIIACMVSPGFYFVAVVPAIVLLAAYTTLVFTNVAERRTTDDSAEEGELTAEMDDVMEDHAEDDQWQPDNAKIVRRETKIGVSILGVVLLAAFIIASVLLPWGVVVLGGFVIFAYLLFIAMPLWLGWFNDDVDIETQRQSDMPDPKQAKTSES